MGYTEVFAGLTVTDLERAVDFYEKLFGRRPDGRPNPEEAMWQLTESGWLYLSADGEPAGQGLVTFLVDDLDATLAEAVGHGLAFGEIETIPGAVRSVRFTDTDGNRLQLAQPLQTQAGE